MLLERAMLDRRSKECFKQLCWDGIVSYMGSSSHIGEAPTGMDAQQLNSL